MNKIFIRANWDNLEQEKRWEELKLVLGIKNNAKAFKKLIEVLKL